MKFKAKKDFFRISKNTPKFSINKLSNLWRKSFIRFVNVSKQPLVIALKFSQFQRSFSGTRRAPRRLVLDLQSIIQYRCDLLVIFQKRLNIFEKDDPFYNCLFVLNLNSAIKNRQYFSFFNKRITNGLYRIQKTNNLIREYYLQSNFKSISFFGLSKKKKTPSFITSNKNSSIRQGFWDRNFYNLKKSLEYSNFFSIYSNSSNQQTFKNTTKIQYNAKLKKQLLNINNIYLDFENYLSFNLPARRECLEETQGHTDKLAPIYQNIWFQNFERSNQNTYLLQRPINYPAQWIQKGDLLADCSASDKGEIALGKNLLVAYMPWEGFNFEDAVLINETILSKYTSLHIAKYDLEVAETANKFEQITANIPGYSKNELQKLDKNGIIKIGSWVQEGDILVGKIISTVPQPLLTHEKLLYDIMGQKTPQIEAKCLRVPLGVSGRIIRISYIYSKRESYLKTKQKIKKKTLNSNKPKKKRIQKFQKSALKKISIYIMEKRDFQVGDKISGRHGNKGIISKVFSNYDMPYLSDGSTLDVILNPLGVPSRMNVGQILECLLGFAGKIFHTKFQVLCFDEIYGYEASRSYIYSKLLDACKKTQQKWIFSKKNPGKLHLFDGRNGYLFHQSVMIGVTYLMKLIHIVDEKIHARATGPYSLITQQPLRGRAKHGGQRIGEMEVWALQGFGCAYTLQELLTVKSDDLQGRKQIMQALLKNTPLNFGTPESFRVVLRELQCLCLDLQLSL